MFILHYIGFILFFINVGVKGFTSSLYNSHKIFSRPNDKHYLQMAFESPVDISKWYDMNECQVLFPALSKGKIPRAIIHLTGGFVFGSIAPIAYDNLCSYLSELGYLIVVTPYAPLETDHEEIARKISLNFQKCYYQSLTDILGDSLKDVPIFGMSHSLGGKLCVLMCSNKELRKQLPSRSANIFLAFNNFSSKQSLEFTKSTLSPEIQSFLEKLTGVSSKISSNSVDSFVKQVVNTVGDKFEDVLLDEDAPPIALRAARVIEETSDLISNVMKGLDFGSSVSVEPNSIQEKLANVKNIVNNFQSKVSEKNPFIKEFIPSPEETYQLLLKGYNVQENYLIKFTDDNLDQSSSLKYYLNKRGCDSIILETKGTHITPNTLNFNSDLIDKAQIQFLRELSRLLEMLSEQYWGSGKDYRQGIINDDEFKRKLRQTFYLPE